MKRRLWFRALCWALTYLLYVDTLAVPALRYGLSGGSQEERRAILESSGAARAEGTVLWVDAQGGCAGRSPCFASIQAAIDAAVERGNQILADGALD